MIRLKKGDREASKTLIARQSRRLRMRSYYRAKMKIELQLVPVEEKQVLKRMIELYLYDLSEYDPLALNGYGEFGYRYLDHYWTEPERRPFFVRIDGKLGGFVLLNRFGFTDGLDCSIAEHFIMRNYRKRGVGRRVAFEAFDRFRGLWEVRAHARNEVAKAFWRSVISDYTDGSFSELEKGLKEWSGPIWTFDNTTSQPLRCDR